MFSKFAARPTGRARRSRWLGPVGMVSAAAVLAVAATGGGIALAGNSSPAPGTITACYHPEWGPAPLKVPTGSKTTCPKGDKTLTWNQSGPQGPAGPAGPQGPAGPSGGTVGAWGSSSTAVSITPGGERVVKTDPVPVSGFYFVSVSMQFSVNANDILICRMITVNGVHGTADAFTGQFPNDTYQTLPITDAVKLAAGDAPAVSCTNNSSSGNTFFAFGTITATLISSPTPALSRVNNAQLKRPRTPEAATAVPVA